MITTDFRVREFPLYQVQWTKRRLGNLNIPIDWGLKEPNPRGWIGVNHLQKLCAIAAVGNTVRFTETPLVPRTNLRGHEG